MDKLHIQVMPPDTFGSWKPNVVPDTVPMFGAPDLPNLAQALGDYSSTPRIKIEADPHGKDAHEPGAKLDQGKPRPALVLGGFARALLEVSKVGTYGALKYSDNGWMRVPNGEERYDDAKLRHWLKEKVGQPLDPDTELAHAAHEAWNSLARLDLMLRKRESMA